MATAMNYLFSSRKRHSDASTSSSTWNNASQYGGSSNSNKRSRTLLDLTIPSPTKEPPLLAQAQTFESTSTTSSSSPSSLPPRHSHEYYSAISSARTRLTAAQRTLSQTTTLLQTAQAHHAQSLREVQEAQAYLNGVETKWGVVVLDNSDDDEDDLEEFEESDGVLIGRRDDCGGSGSVQLQQQQVVVVGRKEHQQQAMTVTVAQSIEITSSGESLVNGIYHHSTTSNSATSNIYIHSSGPFHIHQQNYDVCLFPKVYGDKFRWCVGLVPCSSTCHDNVGGSSTRSENGTNRRSNTNKDEQHHEQQEQQQQKDNDMDNRTRDFDLAFIYYWTNDIPLPSNNQEEMSVIPSLSVVHWGACHGERPLPNISFGGRRWWQFWKG